MKKTKHILEDARLKFELIKTLLFIVLLLIGGAVMVWFDTIQTNLLR